MDDSYAEWMKSIGKAVNAHLGISRRIADGLKPTLDVTSFRVASAITLPVRQEFIGSLLKEDAFSGVCAQLTSATKLGTALKFNLAPIFDHIFTMPRLSDLLAELPEDELEELDAAFPSEESLAPQGRNGLQRLSIVDRRMVILGVWLAVVLIWMTLVATATDQPLPITRVLLGLPERLWDAAIGFAIARYDD